MDERDFDSMDREYLAQEYGMGINVSAEGMALDREMQAKIHAAVAAGIQPGVERYGGELAELHAALAAAREREAGLVAWQALVTEAIGDAFEIAEDLNASVEFEGKTLTSQIVDCLRPWLDTSDGNRVSPPAALENLRRRERSIGAEERLRKMAADWYKHMRLWTAQDFIDLAAAIAGERHHIAGVGKKVEGEGE